MPRKLTDDELEAVVASLSNAITELDSAIDVFELAGNTQEITELDEHRHSIRTWLNKLRVLYKLLADKKIRRYRAINATVKAQEVNAKEIIIDPRLKDIDLLRMLAKKYPVLTIEELNAKMQSIRENA